MSKHDDPAAGESSPVGSTAGSMLGPTLTDPGPTASAAPDVDHSAGAAELALTGFRVGVTSHRRSRDLIEALERRGADVLYAPALKIAPVEEDLPLAEDTLAIIAARPDILIVTTAYGMRRWCEAADASGIGEELLGTLGNCRIFVRGPKARGAVRAAGLNDVGISSDETTATLVDLVYAEGVRDVGPPLAGKTIAVQLHGYTDVKQLDRLRAAGATVLTVTPYRWVRPEGEDLLPKLIDAVCQQELDVVTFTSAPAVDALWSTAHEMGRYHALIDSFKTSVVAAAVGPVTAKPLLDAGITALIPERFRMGALIRLVCEHLERTGVRTLQTQAGQLELRGRALRVNGMPVELAPAPLLLIRALLEAGGSVLPRDTLVRLLDQRGAEHALDMTVSRLRAALPDAAMIETVLKRGYRLRV
ncbi:uroporphyrinogen-III synthase [Paenarthrobacter sp. PH39-S1]|nr:uroporphyrinogen-III synthase [Paenarthrobacter sp. PH39-S1]